VGKGRWVNLSRLTKRLPNTIRTGGDLSEPKYVVIIVPVPNADSVLTARIDWQFRPSARPPDEAHRAGRQAVSQTVAR